jgi:DNA-directed RNA polymerase specialized sigma24 family protein
MNSGADLTTHSDETLLLRIAQDDKEAFLMIYDRYAADVYTYSMQLIRRSTSGKNARDKAQKILIGVFMSLWKDRKTPSGSLTLIDHLYSEVHNGLAKCWECSI